MGWCLMALILEKRQRGSSSNRKGQASQIRRAVTTARLEIALAGLKFIRREEGSAKREGTQARCQSGLLSVHARVILVVFCVLRYCFRDVRLPTGTLRMFLR